MDRDVWDMVDQDVTRILEEMRKGGYFELQQDGRYRAITTRIDSESPYLFFATDKAHGACHLFFDIFFMRFGIIPSFCQKNCWKVVIKCEDFAEFWDVMEKVETLGVMGKGGADPRQYTGSFWPVFLYAHTPEEGKENWVRAMSMLGNAFSGRVILKQGCTEMEMKQPTSKWRVSADQARLEKMVIDRLDMPMEQTIVQPDWLKRNKVREWARQAHMIGDKSYRKIWGDSPLYVEPKTYHDDSWLEWM